MAFPRPKVGDIWLCVNRYDMVDGRHALVVKDVSVYGDPRFDIIWLESGNRARLGFNALDWTYTLVA